MKGMIEILEPFIAITFAVILATIMGATAYKFLDILGREMTERHPSMLSLQLAGLTAAVASAPQQAVYCQKVQPGVDLATKFQKNGLSGFSVVVSGIRETSATASLFEKPTYEAAYIGPMPQPYPIDFYVEFKRNKPKILAIRKIDETITIQEIDKLEDCEGLI
jgi:hypothetical protein